ncbi:MAG: rRNA maturation RNase YbeY [Alphaproteobacteria bacterium]|nr:rRNA maturation RNase YbeY [Alphaproteobacteria bacterium]
MPELVDVVIEDARWQAMDLMVLAQTACGATLAHLDMAPKVYEIALLACDDPRICALNSDFRDKPQATNILSWPAFELAAESEGSAPDPVPNPGATEPVFLGDMAISYDTCMAEARAQSKSAADHVTHLLVHGCLHLLGYDHVLEKDACLMEGLEVSILANLNISDPY